MPPGSRDARPGQIPTNSTSLASIDIDGDGELESYPQMAAFTAAKAALETFVRCTSNELAEHGIRLNAIALSTVLTEKVRKLKRPEYHDRYLRESEVAELVLDLVANASPLISGNVIQPLKYSRSFFHEGYFARNRQREDG